MKFTIVKIHHIFILNLIILNHLFFSSEALAWGGYDYDKKTEIDIGPGNLVREGNVIQYYDSLDDNFHTAKITVMQDSAGGVELSIIDLDTKKERNFIMYQ